jgi:hypothetical protein
MKWTGLLLVSMSMFATADSQTVRMEDRSDWWSMYNEKEPGLPVELVEKNFDIKNFNILGLSLDTLGFDQVRVTLGKAKIVDRGDASYGRSQVCYVSGHGSEPVHLIFEGGEGMSSSFYLFRGGPDWKGSNLCVKSDRVSVDLTTGTGLRLGLSRAEVETILGKPDSLSGDRVAYCREFQRKATKEEFERSRREYPAPLSDKLAHEKFDYVPVTIQVEARFKNLELNYLYVSTTSQSDD